MWDWGSWRRVARAPPGYECGSNSARNFRGGFGAQITAATRAIPRALTRCQRPTISFSPAPCAALWNFAAAFRTQPATFQLEALSNQLCATEAITGALAITKIGMLRAASRLPC